MKIHTLKFIIPFLLILLLQGCGSLFGSSSNEPTATPTREYALVPTFTPTVASAEQPATPTQVIEATATTEAEIVLAATETATTEPTAAVTSTVQTNEAKLTVTGEIINMRGGPGTSFETVGTASKGEVFSLVAKNAAGDWWQVCCINGQQGWVFGELASVENADAVAIAPEIPTPVQPTPNPIAEAATATPEPATAAPQPVEPKPAAPLPVVDNGSAGDFNPNAIYQIVHFKVLGLDENNGGIRDSRAQHLIFVTVIDQNGNGVDGAVVENLVGDKSQTVMGSKGSGKAEITMYYDAFKLRVLSDPSGPVTSQVSNQMGLAFPHLPDIVGKLGGLDYEYTVCPTIDVKCSWPIQGVHYSYEITFQRVK